MFRKLISYALMFKFTKFWFHLIISNVLTSEAPIHVQHDNYELFRPNKTKMQSMTTFCSNFIHFQCILSEIHENWTLGRGSKTIFKPFTLVYIFRNSKMETCQWTFKCNYRSVGFSYPEKQKKESFQFLKIM
jgi:hypothetical protein